MSEPRLAVLDIGGTLVTGPDRGPARRIAELAGMDDGQRRALHAALMTQPFESPSAVADFTRATLGVHAAEAIEEVWVAQLGEAEPIEGVLPALEAMLGRGLRLALLSNIWLPYLESVRRHFGDFFDEHIPEALQVFSFRAGLAKPDPRLLRRVLEAARVDPADAVMIGDSYDKDIAPAAELGMGTVRVTAGATARA
jgi:HAD superfamily hydrolase (TIGR01509 family)